MNILNVNDKRKKQCVRGLSMHCNQDILSRHWLGSSAVTQFTNVMRGRDLLYSQHGKSPAKSWQ